MDNFTEKFQGKKGLVVDDEPLIREMIILDFEDYGASMKEAGGAFEAIELLEKENFDFVISDVRMPQGSGEDLLRIAKEKNLSSNFVIVSGFSDLTEEKAKSLGAQALLTKPFQREDLLNTVANSFS